MSRFGVAPRPWKPAAELEAVLDRGDLRYATSLAKEPIPLDVAAWAAHRRMPER